MIKVNFKSEVDNAQAQGILREIKNDKMGAGWSCPVNMIWGNLHA